jgi:hypothetical protein
MVRHPAVPIACLQCVPTQCMIIAVAVSAGVVDRHGKSAWDGCMGVEWQCCTQCCTQGNPTTSTLCIIIAGGRSRRNAREKRRSRGGGAQRQTKSKRQGEGAWDGCMARTSPLDASVGDPIGGSEPREVVRRKCPDKVRAPTIPVSAPSSCCPIVLNTTLPSVLRHNLQCQLVRE